MNPQDLQNRIERLEQSLFDLTSEVYSNNFSSSQDFNKYSNFKTRLKVPHYASLPTKGEVGEILEVSGILYVCSSANTFTKVGLQS